MTSEVVVMNRLGIALASDSAATVFVGERAKFYHADKLFMLSNYHPVGAMVYNNSSLLGVPWETILKMYRAHLQDRQFDTLEEYAANLIEYLNGNQHLFPPEVQRKYFLQLVRTLFSSLSERAKDEFYAAAVGDVANARTELKKTQDKIVQESLKEWREKEDVSSDCFGADVGATLVASASNDISDLVAKYFESAEHGVVNALFELARLVVSKKEILTGSMSGLVIAGFGSKDYFPAMQEYELGEIFQNKLKFNLVGSHRIDSDTPSIIKPFAQSEMVETFLHGVSPAFDGKFTRELIKIMLALPDTIVDGMPGVSKAKKEAYKSQVKPIIRSLAKSTILKLDEFREERHYQPILQSIEFLPKNELAHVAASLVNLSSFQKRMSISEDETVGGPIDVAVISKGDGFVWIDRKHYFKPELNRHFFRSHHWAGTNNTIWRGDGKEEGSSEGDAAGGK